MKPLIAGNWKMYGRRSHLGAISTLAQDLGGLADAVDVLVCPPIPLIFAAAAEAARAGDKVLIGAQDCSEEVADGAFTGDVSATMLVDAGAKHVICGHSERRAGRGEADILVRIKAEAAGMAGLAPIVCVGEPYDARLSGRAGQFVTRQLAGSLPHVAPLGLTVAYEPVWAVGTDQTPTAEEIEGVHATIRAALTARFGSSAGRIRIVYGGSVNPKNAASIFAIPGVDGALVGRASLNAADFAAIIRAHPAAA